MTDTPNRDGVARLMYDEALALRQLQESRMNDLRKRATTITSILVSVIVVAAGLSRGDLNRVLLGLSAGFAVVALLAAAYAVLPRGEYVEGPNIAGLHKEQYIKDHPPGRVMRDLAIYHYDIYNTNEDGPIKHVTCAVTVQLASVSIAVLMMLLCYAV
ncbi:MAG: hypothetical protein AB7R77_06010 [Ilumatobacteraceae bacterium]